MAGPYFNDPSYGWNSPDIGQTAGILGQQPPQQRGILGGGGFSSLLDPSIALPAAAAMIGGRNLQESLAGGFAAAAPGVVNMQKRAAINDWLKAKSSGDPAMLERAKQNLISVVPEIGQQIAAYDLTPKAPIVMSPGATLAQYDQTKGYYTEPNGASGRGGGSPYDLEQGAKAYKAQFGEGANLAIDAPDFQSWYRSAWPQFGQGQAGGGQGQGAGGGQPLPKRPLSDTDIRRYNMAANAATKNWIELPGYKLVSQGAPYLSRIESAAQHPGSISDQELLDSVTKLNNAGGQVTEAQVAIVLKGASLRDKAQIWANQLGTGGVLSDDQRKQLIDVAHAVYKGYQKMYQPVYDDAIRKLKAQGIPEAYWNIPDLNKLSNAAGIAGGGGEAPAIGAVEDGFEFKGGNPADPNSWAPVQ